MGYDFELMHFGNWAVFSPRTSAARKVMQFSTTICTNSHLIEVQNLIRNAGCTYTLIRSR